MGYQDRDYFRPGTDRWYWRAGGSVCRALVVINVVIFVIQVLSAPGLAYGFRGSQGFFTDALVMDPEAVFEHGQVWRLFTSFFLHSPFSIWHLIINMFVLWFFGPDMEDHYGPREFLVFYLAAGVLSSLVWGLCAYWLEPMMHASFLQNPEISEEAREIAGAMAKIHKTALGASGAVTAVMILCAWHYPHRPICFWFIEVPLWLVAAVYVFMDFMVLYQGTHTGTGVAAHLTGAAFGTLYYYFNWRLVPLGSDLRLWFKRARGPKLRVVRAEPQRAAKEADFDERVDEVLAKLKNEGREKLSAEELEVLQQASERYRKRKT